MQVMFLRHGQTQGNLEGRYIGRTDEPLCEAGAATLAARPPLPRPARLYVSPLRRCVESAALLFPGQASVAVADFRECDFGAFEGKNYAELNGDADYQAWIDSGGELAFPGGESRASFQDRCCAAFARVAAALLAEEAAGGLAGPAAFVVHGGTIMAILSRYGASRRGYFDWQVKNGEGFAGELTYAGGEICLERIEKLPRA